MTRDPYVVERDFGSCAALLFNEAVLVGALFDLLVGCNINSF